jgi:ABC-2 type transport system permease protein
MTCRVPVAFGSTGCLPFLGALTALMDAVVFTNLYGHDGRALWLTLVTPDSERVDVRGRQGAWLLLFGPATVVLTVAGAAVSGRQDLWPWALAATACVTLACIALASQAVVLR